MARLTASRRIENSIRRLGFFRVAGVDEVGRGCLAGPVVAAAVVLDSRRPISGIRDSKLLSSKARERLFLQILERAVAYAVGSVGPDDIDRLNIHNASLLAMREAVKSLVPPPDFVLVDGFPVPDIAISQRALIGGDRRSVVVAAASILAKVTRDRQMCELHDKDPRYGFDRHKGYATAEHVRAIGRHGYSIVHRKSFKPKSLFTRK